ncbi:hypothetical protein Dimus_016134 [Dionaea muscipula]
MVPKSKPKRPTRPKPKKNVISPAVGENEVEAKVDSEEIQSNKTVENETQIVDGDVPIVGEELQMRKNVVKSSVKGVTNEFDHDKLASILGVPGKNGICEYIKDVWEESKYRKPLEITKRFANDETLTTVKRVKSGEMKPF